jgi:hypothetical protein
MIRGGDQIALLGGTTGPETSPVDQQRYARNAMQRKRSNYDRQPWGEWGEHVISGIRSELLSTLA